MNDTLLKYKMRNLNDSQNLKSYRLLPGTNLIKHIDKPAVRIDLKQDFWSILGHITYLACGFRSFIANMDNTNAIPVATGTVKQPFTDCTPNNKPNIESFVSLKTREAKKTF